MSTTRRKPTQQRSRDRVDAILRGTGEVIRTQGVDALSPTTIAQASSVPASAIYQYFDNSDDVLRTFIDSEFKRIASAIAESVLKLETVSLRTLFDSVAQAHLGYFLDHPETVALWIGGRMNRVVAETVSIHSSRLATSLDAASRRAELIKPDTPEWSAEIAIRAFDRTFEFIFSKEREEAEIREMVDHLTDMIATFAELRYATERGVEGIPAQEFVAALGSASPERPREFLAAEHQDRE